MGILLEVVEGDQAGARFRIQPGLTIGRKNTDILLHDSKVSSQHAVLEEMDGKIVLRDLGSSNGVKVDGIRLPFTVLAQGVVVQLGRTFLRVIEESAPDAFTEEASVDSWASLLMKATREAVKNSKTNRTELLPFNPAVRLTVLKGLQFGQVWTLGYGPREAGAKSIDLPLRQTGCPDQCFELTPHNNKVLFKTSHPDLVLLNGQSISAEYLANGDSIQILETCIRVELEPYE